MNKKLFLIVIFIINFILLSINPINVNAMNDIDQVGQLYSLSAAMIDGDTGRVLYDKNGTDIRPMASTTKIMTLIMALEYGNSDDILTVTSYSAKMPDVQLGIKEGEQYKMYDLYYSLMLESHNDVAVAIAEHIGGNVTNFSNMMNKKASELGLVNTYFITANGLDESDDKGTHSTTAIELAKLMKYCVFDSPKKDDFIKICQTNSYSFKDYSGKRYFTVNNKNALLNMVDGVIAGKTGFTADAGYCYVVAINKDNKTYIISLLGCGWPNNKNYKWKDTQKLLKYGIDNYSTTILTDINTPMKTVNIPNGTPKDYINTYINDFSNILIGKNEKIKLEYVVPRIIEPPIMKGTIVGQLNIFINNNLYKSINVYSSDTIYKKDMKFYIDLIVDTLF